MKHSLLFFLLGMLCLAAQAVPADPTPMKVTQPDGMTLTVTLHGDEFFNYLTTTDGYTVVKNDKGFYTYARLNGDRLVAGDRIARDADYRTAADRAALTVLPKRLTSRSMQLGGERMKARRNDAMLGVGANGHMDYSKFRGLIILINYTDKTFENYLPYNYETYDFYNEMINGHGYTGYTMPSGTKREMTGSVRDFYYDNSNQVFDPTFDILGPVNVDFAATDANQMANCDTIFFSAVQALDDQIDFSQYDTDGDGTVDMVFFLVAGWGSDYSSNNRKYLWPHMFTFEESPVVDGVNFGLYACSTAMTGAEPQWGNGTIGGIGTFCHEFSHVLGLPDLYDADYSGSGGQSQHPGYWSIMASGFKVNNGYNPVGYSLYERYALGFAQPTLISATGDSVSLQALDVVNTGYRLNTPVENEFFLLENRQQTGKWDKYLPGHGMLVFHVDSTDVDIWENNQVNNNPNHMYYQMLRANYNNMSDSQRDPYPGASNVTTISNMTNPGLRTWSGQLSKYSITNIAEADGVITFDVVRDRTLADIEDFEEMPVGATLSEQNVTGVFANWNFTNCAVVDTAQVGVDCGHTVAFKNGSYISTVENLTIIPEVVRFTVYNPTDASAVFYVYYSKDNGSRWLEADYPGYVTVPAGSKATATVTTLPTDVPIMLRIKQTTGSSDKPCYLDDVTLYYEGPEVPDFVLGDVNNDGYVSIKDVTTLIDHLLGSEVEINMDAADVKTDGIVSISDVTALIDVLLSNNGR